MRIDELHPTITSVEPLEIPDELLASVSRHQKNLATLIGSLRAAGLGEDMVEASVRTLVQSYAEELTLAIRSMLNEARHG